MTVTGAEAYTTAYTYDLNNRLTREARSDTAGMSVTNYNYDPNGNLISKGYETYSTAGEDAESLALDISDAYIDSYVYNVRNQLVSAQTGGTVSTYSYNASGMRNAKTVDGETTYQVWSNGNVISEYGAHTAVYRYGNGLVDATEGGVQRYYLYNGHGDTTQLVNSQGSVIADYQYDAFGNQTGGENADVYNPFRYNGQYTDEETGLIYLRNRYYDPATGRFMTEDPAKDGLNWYVYCSNNPVLLADPWGLEPGDIFESMDAAAMDAAAYAVKLMSGELKIGNSSDYIDKEVIVAFLKKSSGQYSYTLAKNTSKTPEYAFEQGGIRYLDQVSLLHTHPADVSLEYFYDEFSSPGNSASDKGSDEQFAEFTKQPLYLATADGKLFKLEPGQAAEDATLIADNLYQDPRIEIYNDFKGGFVWSQLAEIAPGELSNRDIATAIMNATDEDGVLALHIASRELREKAYGKQIN